MALGWVVRIVVVLGSREVVPRGDAYVYFHGGQLLVDGQGWINVNQYLVSGGRVKVPAASFPPLFTIFEAIPHFFGLHTFLEARLFGTLLGALGIVVIAMAGRAMAGETVGLLAAGIATIYPNLWIPSTEGMSEAMTPLLVAWILLLAYRFWRNPSYKWAIWLGVAFGISMLGRDEIAAGCVLLYLPLALLLKGVSWKRRFQLLGTGALCVALVIAPWVGYNLSRFDKPTYISTGLGVTLASANCDDTWYGTGEAYWSMNCVVQLNLDPHLDESAQSALAQKDALHYINQHLSKLPLLSVERLGRSFGFYRPAQQMQFDSFIEGRPYHWAVLGLATYYALAALSLLGAWVLRRSRILQFPLWSFGLISVATTLLSFGQTRYRITFEVPLVLLASAALIWAFSAVRHRRGDAGWKPQPAPTSDF
jgi:4-amino-4-deoxy-L-arabinose transferase-like glycosyltransferase